MHLILKLCIAVCQYHKFLLYKLNYLLMCPEQQFALRPYVLYTSIDNANM